jgi:hypothetical protein
MIKEDITTGRPAHKDIPLPPLMVPVVVGGKHSPKVIDKHVFNWDAIPGKDEKTLCEFLKEKLGVDTTNATIRKPNPETIQIDAGDESVSITLDAKTYGVSIRTKKHGGRELEVRLPEGRKGVYDYSILFDAPPAKGFIELTQLPEGVKPGEHLSQGYERDDEETSKQCFDLLEKIRKESPYFIVWRDPLQVEAAKTLRNAGISAEKIIQDLRNGTYLVEREGVALGCLDIDTLTKVGKDNIVDGIANLLGRMHKTPVTMSKEDGRNFNAITHGHPHAGNIVLLKGGAFGIIDFKFVTAKNVDWNDAGDIALTFAGDYYKLWEAFTSINSEAIIEKKPELMMADVDIRRTYEKMIKHYPTTPETRKQLMEILEKSGFLTLDEPEILRLEDTVKERREKKPLN